MKRPAKILAILLITAALVAIMSRRTDRETSHSDSSVTSSEHREAKASDRPLRSAADSSPARAEADPVTKPLAMAHPPAVPEPDGSMPQGTETRPVPATQAHANPRDYEGVIIPERNLNAYVPGMMASATVTVGKKSGTLSPNQRGVFPQVVIVPNATAEISLSYPDLKRGEAIYLDCPDGGTINGETALTLHTDAAGNVRFTWQGNSNLGTHSVCCVAGPDADEKTLSFWVGPRAYADASAVPR